MAGRSTHTIQFKISFSRKDSAGYYYGVLMIGGNNCADLGAGGVDSIYKHS